MGPLHRDEHRQAGNGSGYGRLLRPEQISKYIQCWRYVTETWMGVTSGEKETAAALYVLQDSKRSGGLGHKRAFAHNKILQTP